MFYVYRFYAKDGQLLYVGCTGSPETRFAIHRRTTVWYPEVERTVIDLIGPDKGAALSAERHAITAEAPKYNKNGKGGLRPAKARVAPRANSKGDRNFRLRALHALGFGPTVLAKLFKVSRQRAHQIAMYS